jgi:hypothetical protein
MYYKKSAMIAGFIALSTSQATLAYNICNKSNVPISVIVVESEAKAQDCLRYMGWNGECWDFATGQTIACKSPLPHASWWLVPQPGLDVFKKPQQYIQYHKVNPQDACGRYNWRDIQRNNERKNLSELYFMIFEKFKRKSSQRIHFLASGYYNAQNTISFSGSADTGWKITSEQ